MDSSANGQWDGIGMLPGSCWAHHELGWGGWWFRDPVENMSFMPWLIHQKDFYGNSGISIQVFYQMKQ
ncbi:hypothetical protein HPP92_006263 [Vanilla planifolia]|uniref:Cytochrome c assembly protein domain-containing protein n=1 Tax=Vanilla planifolia TaxID=51239 RepID=A0A835RTK8_VANPL|nr:hypothetical protein HPP92_006263 [Vanilla planifolia]